MPSCEKDMQRPCRIQRGARYRLMTGGRCGRAIAAYGNDAHEAVKPLIIASNFVEARLAEMQTAVSTGYASPFPS